MKALFLSFAIITSVFTGTTQKAQAIDVLSLPSDIMTGGCYHYRHVNDSSPAFCWTYDALSGQGPFYIFGILFLPFAILDDNEAQTAKINELKANGFSDLEIQQIIDDKNKIFQRAEELNISSTEEATAMINEMIPQFNASTVEALGL